MIIMNMKLRTFAMVSCALLGISCGESFLDVKQDRNQNIPHTLADCAALVNGISYSRPARDLALLGSDEYYVKDEQVSSIRARYMRNAYLWADEVYEGEDIPDWT